MENKRPTQANRVIEYMKLFGSITQMQAMNDIGVMRLASRISELKTQGYQIKSNFETVKNRYGEKCSIKRYYLEEGDQNEAV